MPYIRIETNQNVTNQKAVLKKLSEISAAAMGKPETYIQTAIASGTEMTFAGTDEPTAFVQCKSIGLSESRTESISSAICTYCENEIAVPRNRVYIEFIGVSGKMWGWNGNTF